MENTVSKLKVERLLKSKRRKWMSSRSKCQTRVGFRGRAVHSWWSFHRRRGFLSSWEVVFDQWELAGSAITHIIPTVNRVNADIRVVIRDTILSGYKTLSTTFPWKALKSNSFSWFPRYWHVQKSCGTTIFSMSRKIERYLRRAVLHLVTHVPYLRFLS